MSGVLLFLLGMVWLDLALGFRVSITVYAGCIQIGLGGLWVCGCLVLVWTRA
jgi:hypothetical protein